MSLNLPVMIIMMALAGCLEEFIPGIPLRVPAFAGVAVYYALQRPLPLAGVAAVAAGIAHDASCGVPIGGSALLLLAFAAGVAALRDVILDDSAATAALSGAVLGFLLCLLQRALLGFSYVSAHGFAWLAAAAGTGALSGAAASALFFVLGRKLDRMAMNVKPGKEIDGFGNERSPV